MAKRKLGNEEKKFSLKNMESMQEELDFNQYQLDVCQLKLDRGLKVEYDKQVRTYKTLKSEYFSKVEMMTKNINILKEQLEKGVEIKEIKEVK